MSWKSTLQSIVALSTTEVHGIDRGCKGGYLVSRTTG